MRDGLKMIVDETRKDSEILKRSREEARKRFHESGIMLYKIPYDRRQSLVWFVNNSIEKSINAGNRVIPGLWAFIDHSFDPFDIQLKSDYFENRQGITFQKDGFIGFCAELDDWQASIILRGFHSWLDSVIEEVEG